MTHTDAAEMADAIKAVATALRGGELLFAYEPTVRDQVSDEMAAVAVTVLHDLGWQPPPVDVASLRAALDHIRIAALLHYVGGGFDPEHMRGIATLAARALDGQTIEPLPDLEQLRQRAGIWGALADDTD